MDLKCETCKDYNTMYLGHPDFKCFLVKDSCLGGITEKTTYKHWKPVENYQIIIKNKFKITT